MRARLKRADASPANPEVQAKKFDEQAAMNRWWSQRIQQAIVDPKVFFELVMREEFTRARLRTVPHQRVFFDFVMAHPNCVVRQPVGSSKSFCAAALTLWLLGNEPTERGVIISSSQGQSSKLFSMVRGYIENGAVDFPELLAVFPLLRPSQRPGEPWTQTKLVVDRPAGIRDPSLTAIGEHGSLPGSRLSWILVDDVLDDSNTRTAEERTKLNRWFGNTVLGRLDPEKSRCVVINTPWDPGDLTYYLENEGRWPTLTMDADGGIQIVNTDWDTDDIRPSSSPGPYHRLTAHDAERYGAPLTTRLPDGRRLLGPKPNGKLEHHDVDEAVTLWPEKFDRKVLDNIRDVRHRGDPQQYNQLYRMKCRDESSARCKKEWIDRCLKAGREAGAHSFVREYTGQNLTVTGVDLAMGLEERHDYTAFFTFELLPDGKRRILDIEFGRYEGKQIVDRLHDKARRFKSFIRVETNGGQMFLKQWALDKDLSVPVRAHHTGSNKHHRSFGIEGVFIELENGAWIIPNDPRGGIHPAVEKWIEECLYYDPRKHTGDLLMASYLAREEARYFGSSMQGSDDNVGVSILAR